MCFTEIDELLRTIWRQTKTVVSVRARVIDVVFVLSACVVEY